MWIALVIVLVVVIAAVAGGSDKPHSSDQSAHAAVSAPAAASPSKSKAQSDGGESRDQKNAVAYIHSYGQLAGQVQAQVQTAEIELGIFAKHPTEHNLAQLADGAVGAHSGLDDIRKQFAGDFGDGELGSAQVEVFAAANDLKNSMGTLATFTGDPSNAETAAEFKQQFQNAAGEWNQGVRTIWRLAKVRHPPTV